MKPDLPELWASSDRWTDSNLTPILKSEQAMASDLADAYLGRERVRTPLT